MVSLFEGRTSIYTGLICREHNKFLCFWLALLHSETYFFLYWPPSSSLCMVFYSFSSKIDEVFSISPSAEFVFGNFNIHHKDWLTYSGGNDRSDELCYNFSMSSYLNQMVNFPTRIPDCVLKVLLFLIYLFLETSICSTMAFPPFRNSDHVVVSVSIDFPLNSQWDALFYDIAYDCSHTDWGGICDHLRDVPWEYI